MKKRISLLLALCMLLTVVPFGSIFASAATGVDAQYWACDNGGITTYVDDSPSFSSSNFTEGSASLALEAKADNALFTMYITTNPVDITGATHLVFDIWCEKDNMLDGATGWTDLYAWTAAAKEGKDWDPAQPYASATAAGNVASNNGPEQTAFKNSYAGLKAGWNTVVIQLDSAVANGKDVSVWRLRLGEMPAMKAGDKVFIDDFRFVSTDVLETVVPVRAQAKKVIAQLAAGIANLDCSEALAAYSALSEEAKAYVPAALLEKAQSLKTGVDVQFRGFNDDLQNAWSYFKDDSLSHETVNYLEGTGAACGEIKSDAQDLYLFLPAHGDGVDVSGASYLSFDVWVPADNYYDGGVEYWSDVRGDDAANENKWGEYDQPAVYVSKDNAAGIRQAMTGLKAGWNNVVMPLDYTTECTKLVSLRIRITSNGFMHNVKIGDKVIFDDVRFMSSDVVANELPKRNAAKNVTLSIRDLKDADAITLSDEEAVNQVKAAYDAVDNNYKNVVIDVAKLDAAVSKIEQLKQEAAGDTESKKAAEDVDAKINAIGEVTLEKETAVLEAREAYNALNETAKGMVTALKVLEAAEKVIADLKQGLVESSQAQAVDKLIAELPAVEMLTIDDETDLKDARSAYNALSEQAKNLVTGLQKLIDLETKMIEIKANNTPTDGFVIDGKLDEYYIKEDASGNLYYFNHDMIDAWVSDGGWDPYYEVTDHGFEIYTAYDDDYLYFYARAFDTTLTKIENDPNRNDSIALYLDPDPTSWYNSANPDNGGFYFHTDDGNQGDMKFRLNGYDLSLDDMSPHPKTCLGNDTIANWLANANNFKSFYFDDDEDGNNDGYGFEVRIPRVEDNGTYAYNFACGSYKENYADQYTWSLGRSWWIDYNSMAIVEYDDPNPFLNQGYIDPLLAAAKAVDELIQKIPAELTAENYDQYVAATEAARKAYDALEIASKMLVQEHASLETAERLIKNYVPEEPAKRGDINMDDSVNAVDALLVLQAAVGKATLTDKQTAMADLNGDTKIDAVDALVILKIAVGKE